jgi:hypothetical protein
MLYYPKELGNVKQCGYLRSRFDLHITGFGYELLVITSWNKSEVSIIAVLLLEFLMSYVRDKRIGHFFFLLKLITVMVYVRCISFLQ